MRYSEIAPCDALARFVRVIWRLDAADAGPPSARVEPVLPDGCVELIFHFGEPFFERRSDGSLGRQERALVAGPTTRRVELARGARSDVLGVRFHPGGAAMLGLPVRDLRDRIVPFADLGLRELVRIETSLRREPRRSRPRALERILLDLARAASIPRVGLAFSATACGATSASRDPAPIARAGAALGVSSRQFERICLAEAGLAPSELRRLQRFQAALREIERRPDTPFSAIAQTAGFSDESHLSRDFRELAGVTPGEHRRAHGALTSAFVSP